MVQDAVVRSHVVETGFGFYTDDQLKKLSVCQITSPVSQDSLGNPLPGGLMDPRLGPTDQAALCKTCGMNYINCPGHPGHIELDVPIYHPFLFSSILGLLKVKCSRCHCFRMATSKVRQYLIKLKLLEMGDIDAANSVDEVCAAASQESAENKDSSDAESELRGFESRYRLYMNMDPSKRAPASTQCKNLQRELIDGFQKNVANIKKCENCGSFSHSYRRDGYAKIFQKPLSKKVRDSMAAMKMKIKSALEDMQGDVENANIDDSESESDDDSDDDDMNTPAAHRKPQGSKSKVDPTTDKYLVPLEVEAQIRLLWQKNTEYLDFVWSRASNNGVPNKIPNPNGWKIFFSRVILVPPNRFRPAAKVGDSASEHPQNHHLAKIIDANEKIRLIYTNSQKDKEIDIEEIMQAVENMEDPEREMLAMSKTDSLSKLVTNWINLQNAVNCYMDSAKDPNVLSQGGPAGIRQLLERKEGLFRMNMMGKRVNYCARSVISPDPYLGTNEIGIPVKFAKTLHYPTPVCDWNVKHLRTLVERGPTEYPGANMIETPQGQLIKLEKLSQQERVAKAKLLLSSPGYKVYRHLVDGDVLLVNRQPTLHKPGIMAHKARVLKHVREQTLRMNYANCNTYNADFDGDEMNCHFVQNDIARAEANYICNTDNQYIVPTSGNPVRGLIQDHVSSGVKLTCKNTFLTKDQFQQLLYVAVTGLSGTEVIGPSDRIVIPTPAIMKPKPLWTGKQVISSLLAHMCRPPLPPLHLDAKTRTPATVFGAEEQEHVVIFRFGELLTGVLDKAAIGTSSLGVVHAVYELYGPEYAGKLLSAFGRLFTFYLQDAGHSCGIADLTLNRAAEQSRKQLLQQVNVNNLYGLRKFIKGEEVAASMKGPVDEDEVKELEEGIADLLSTDIKNGKVKLDSATQGSINKSASEVIKACLPGGVEQPFLKNNFTLMVLTGAKGSNVNQSQITCFLGQQALEGQRVPIMISGKSLPSFRAFDLTPRAGGFVQDRFLTGVKPQEFYFHCMAGREGLVDTAVKTSRSGYLQRCLVKHLEELKVNYDNTVRDSGHNIVQFVYGEDGLDPVHSAVLGGKDDHMLFLARNNQALVHKYGIDENFFSKGLEIESAKVHHDLVARARKTLASNEIVKTSVVLARRKVNPEGSWSVKNVSEKFEVATVTKVRESQNGVASYDLEYANGDSEKKVPAAIMVKASGVNGMSQQGYVPFSLVKMGLPDTAMSRLNLGNVVGCCSEKIQNKIEEYISHNPHKSITSETTNTTVSAEALELLVWVKYMRSLACPGEAVGCVAAQSIGEPSTQMTLNTFHLAGHGGANVTLGIPRLREIIMTASTKPKTPTMSIPLVPSQTYQAAKSLARQLSKLTLKQMMDHRGGVEVGERLDRGFSGFLERVYRIRLNFEPFELIARAFGIGYEDIRAAVKTSLLPKIARLIRMEQSKAGEKTSGKMDALQQFRSKDSSDSRPVRGSGDGDDDEDGEGRESSGRGKDKDIMDQLMEGDDDDEDMEDDDDNDDDDDNKANSKNKKGSKSKEINGYDDMDDAEEENSEDGDSEHKSSDVENDESDNEVLPLGAKGSNTKGKKGGASTTTDINRTSVNTSLHLFKSGDNIKESITEGWIEVSLRFPADARRLLMVQIVELAAAATTVRSTKGIENAFANQDDHVVHTEGVNFEAVWELPTTLVDHNSIKSNDIYGIMQTYGVEAGRKSIVNEITGVFGAYGIDVNPRHLSLVADFMTRTGGYIPMNRIGMMQCPSTLLQMSFETTCSFLTKAAMEGKTDNQESPSSRLVLGNVTKVGTGCFDVMVPIK